MKKFADTTDVDKDDFRKMNAVMEEADRLEFLTHLIEMVVWISLLITLLAACGKQPVFEETLTAETSTYVRETRTISLPEEANPYMVRFSQTGFAYFVMDSSEADVDSEEDPKLVYRFYFQKYEEEKAVEICSLTDCYVRDFACSDREMGNVLTILTIGSEAIVAEYDGTGKIQRTLALEDSFNDTESFLSLTVLSGGCFLLEENGVITQLDADGNTIGQWKAPGTVKKLLEIPGQDTFVWVEQAEGSVVSQKLYKMKQGATEPEEVRDLPADALRLFALDNVAAVVTKDEVLLLQEGEEQPLLDLNRQSLIGSQIENLVGDRQEIKVVMLDQESKPAEVYLVTLREAKDTPSDEIKAEVKAEDYTEDGRQIVHVAIPAGCVYQVEFHAKRFNKTSDSSFVEIEYFSDSLEEYLGKGKRPDIVMFNDNTEMQDYVQKGILVDLVPLYENQENYSLENMLPRARQILGVTDSDCLYGMAGRFRLLLRSSDGTEMSGGDLTIIGYLDWYDRYLTENEIAGMGDISWMFYPVIGEFFDEETAGAKFTSESFKEIMRAYKTVRDKHNGTLDSGTIRQECGYFAAALAAGPRWEYYYGTTALTIPGGSLEGLPGTDGAETVYMMINYPMSILTTSTCPEEAFDFLMYYNTQGEWLLRGESEGDYGKCGNTWGYFSVYEKYLNEEIYESEKPLVAERGDEVFFTDEQKEHLRDMLSQVVPDTAAQRTIYNMFLEEMEGYLKGDKSLEAACEVLQSRAILYLEERQ